MTRAPGTRERQKADRRERILGTAIQLINERGFAATTYEQIAKRAGVSRGTVFNYFPYKESLLLGHAAAILAEIADETSDKRAADPGWAVEKELRFIFERLGELLANQRQIVLPLSYELLNPDPERSRAAYLALPLADLLKDSLERGRLNGRVRTDHSVERMARTLANTYFITALQWAAYRSDRSVTSELRLALDLTLEGLIQQPS